jgi:hypothetical protein
MIDYTESLDNGFRVRSDCDADNQHGEFKVIYAMNVAIAEGGAGNLVWAVSAR